LHTNCLLKYVNEGKIAGMGILGRRCKMLVDDLEERDDTEN
jgi:hypothetical protein